MKENIGCYKKSMSCRKFVIRHLPIIVSDGMVNERKEIRRSRSPRRTGEFRDDSALCYNGFTLIELLVVVLIIGILAAVALPQYKIAVAKSRVSTIIPIGRAIWEAKEAYYMVNNEYVRDINVLDIDVPTNCTYAGYIGYYVCGKYFLLDNNPGGVALNYCPEHLTGLSDCRAYQDFRLVWSGLYQPEGSLYQAGVNLCVVHNNSKLGQAVCKNLNGFIYAVAGQGLGSAGF